MSIKNAITKTKKKIWELADMQLPRWWDTSMSPAMDTSFIDSMKRWSRLNERARRQGWYRYWRTGQVLHAWAPLTTAESIEWVLHPLIDTAYFVKDVASIPINATRNLYNTWADLYNAQVSKRKAKKMKNAVTSKQ